MAEPNIEYKGYEIVTWKYDGRWSCIGKIDSMGSTPLFWAYEESDVIVLVKGYIDEVYGEEAVSKWLNTK